MPALSKHLSHFPTLNGLRPPRVTVAFAWMIMFGAVTVTAILLFVPWMQTAQGRGQVVALDPADRVQAVTALVSGRVEQWYVQDGQHVDRGDPIARVGDLDPELLSSLAAERAQVDAEIAAVRQSQAVAALDVARTRQLLAEGLAARRDYEQAQIRAADGAAKLAETRAKLNRINVQFNRDSSQLVRAPRDGRIQNINGAAGGALVSPGTVLAIVAPERVERAVELYVDGRDVPLVQPGRAVRLEFEGWPAIQVSGWPGVAQGLFDGYVSAIDPTAHPDGRFRVLVKSAAGKPPWPATRFVRLGGKVRGWIQGETVTAGFELWRQLNDFPMNFGQGADVPAQAPPEKGLSNADLQGAKPQ